MKVALLIALFACLLISTQAFTIRDAHTESRLKRDLTIEDPEDMLALLAGEEGGNEADLKQVLEQLQEMLKSKSTN